MSRVGIIGIGHGAFGRRSDATVQELAFEAFRDAVKDAGIERDHAIGRHQQRIDVDLLQGRVIGH